MDIHGNITAREGCDRCFCGSKYWEKDKCVDCGTYMNISLDKAKRLSREIVSTVHAGTNEHNRLNSMIANAISDSRNWIPLDNWFGNTLIDLYRFYDDVGMLDED